MYSGERYFNESTFTADEDGSCHRARRRRPTLRSSRLRAAALPGYPSVKDLLNEVDYDGPACRTRFLALALELLLTVVDLYYTAPLRSAFSWTASRVISSFLPLLSVLAFAPSLYYYPTTTSPLSSHASNLLPFLYLSCPPLAYACIISSLYRGTGWRLLALQNSLMLCFNFASLLGCSSLRPVGVPSSSLLRNFSPSGHCLLPSAF